MNISQLRRGLTASLVVLGLAAGSPLAQASFIVGSIGFTGAATQNGGSVGNFTTASSMNIVGVGVTPGSTSGAFVGAVNATFASPIGVNGNPPSLVGPWWSVMVGTTTYQFMVTSEAQMTVDAHTLDLGGNGFVTDGNAADNTAGSWELHFGTAGATTFTFGSEATAIVPEASTVLAGALLLLPLGMSTWRLVRSRSRPA